MKNKVREWIELAGIDLAAAKKLAEDEYLSPMASFHAHQCIEKSFKAILEANNQPIVKIHDLSRLYHEINEIISLPCDEDILDDLSRLYIDSRYPALGGYGAYGKPSTDDVNRYIDSAAKVLSDTIRLIDKD